MIFLKKNWIYLLLVCFIIYLFLISTFRTEKLNSNNVIYTVGKVVDIDYSGKVGGYSFVFEYYIDDIKNTGRNFVKKNINNYNQKKLLEKYRDSCFLMKYSSDYNKLYEINIDIPVPDSLYNCNYCSWTILPEWAKKYNAKWDD